MGCKGTDFVGLSQLNTVILYIFYVIIYHLIFTRISGFFTLFQAI